MATIEIRRFEIDPAGVTGHLYYELINDARQRIAQINAFGTDPDTGNPVPLGGPSDDSPPWGFIFMEGVVH